MIESDSVAGKRALVTGASGFIGSRLCESLLRHGADVRGVSRAERDRDGIRWETFDVSDASAVSRCIADARPDLIFHLASHVTGSRSLEAVMPTFNDNLVSTVNVLAAAANTDCERVVLVGSLEEPDADEAPVSPYAAAKFSANAYGRMFHQLYGVPVVNLRVFMVYGPGQRDLTKLVPYVITSLLRGEVPELSSGRRPVDWVYVDDVVDALLACASAGALLGQTVDVGSGTLHTIREVVERVIALMDSSTEPGFGALPDRPGERVRVADVARTRDVLGWSPRTSLDDGLRETIRWFSEQDPRT